MSAPETTGELTRGLDLVSRLTHCLRALHASGLWNCGKSLCTFSLRGQPAHVTVASQFLGVDILPYVSRLLSARYSQDLELRHCGGRARAAKAFGDSGKIPVYGNYRTEFLWVLYCAYNMRHRRACHAYKRSISISLSYPNL